MKQRITAAACSIVAGWYFLVYLVARPLVDAPVVDSWVYARAVEFFRQTGSVRFIGYTQAMPVTQVIYGAAWSRLFGTGAGSLDLSVAVLGAIGGMLFYALARRCGARGWDAVLATALLIGNPCYLFLSFSFMTEIPFLTLLLASHLAFAQARGSFRYRWLWASALAAVLGFMVRPFAAAAMAGSAAATVVFNRSGWSPAALRRTAATLAPFAAGLALCALGWIWMTRMNPEPWMLQRSEHRLEYIFGLSPAFYFCAGVIGPVLYLGLVLSPLALPHLLTRHWRKGLTIGVALFAAALVSMRLSPGLPSIPELSCFGGWCNALQLRGLPTRFSWEGWAQWPALLLSSLSAAGFVIAVMNLKRRLIRRGAVAVVLTAAVYWLGIFPLWLFNDRYYLVMVPAGCLLLALAPPVGVARRTIAIAGLIILGLVSMAGVYDHQRGLQAVLAARDALEMSGVPRHEIDAGYPLNGSDLYPSLSADEPSLASDIPMLTSARLPAYAIAAAPVPGTRIIRRMAWPGPLGFGHRELYVLQRVDAP